MTTTTTRRWKLLRNIGLAAAIQVTTGWGPIATSLGSTSDLYGVTGQALLICGIVGLLVTYMAIAAVGARFDKERQAMGPTRMSWNRSLGVGHVPGGIEVAVAEQHCELVAAQARHDVRFPQQARDAQRGGLQQQPGPEVEGRDRHLSPLTRAAGA